MTTIVLVFAVPLLLASAMIDPAGLHLGGLIACVAIIFVILPFAAWQSFALGAVFSPASSGCALFAVVYLVGWALVAG